MSTLLHAATLVLVEADDKLDPEIEENLTPGWVGAVVIVGLMVVTLLLWLSMRRQFRKIRFEDDPADGGSTPEDGEGGSRP
jgi:hypothetical protein